mmetsp:Transcript_19176/g.27093  ORF Transcript_19176/g.27093 Transcript_19176/m.27093 type:complete len:164 (+) Transcript_19176:706-1197(+)
MPQNANDTNNANAGQQPQGQAEGAGATDRNVENVNNNNGDAQPPAREEQQQSFVRRLLVLAGAIPMSPEEEARALEQLVDMFPQYERADLLRELRDRGSAEAVVDVVILGLFSGVARQGAVAPGFGEAQDNDAAAPENDADEYDEMNENIAFLDRDAQEPQDG